MHKQTRTESRYPAKKIYLKFQIQKDADRSSQLLWQTDTLLICRVVFYLKNNKDRVIY